MKNKLVFLTTIILSTILFGLISAQFAHAILTLNSVVFDPQIIASGDTVDILIQYGADSRASSNSIEASNSQYTFLAKLVADDDLTKDYTIITKSVGQDVARTIIGGQIYAQKFGVKVLDNAPAGTYQYKLIGQWYKNGVAFSDFESVPIYMQVKKEGIVLSVANIQTSPAKIRSGDKDISLQAQIANSGEKLAKNVEITLNLPQGMESSISNNNRVNLGTINAQDQITAHFTLDTDKLLASGVHDVDYTITYQDTDSNKYAKMSTFPINIHKRPYLIVTNVSGYGLAASKATLSVTVKNIGEDTADSSDIRLVKQSSQPFEMDVRTQYLGQLKPNESATAIFTVDVLADATITTHKLTAALRAKGNSNDGDESIYTFTDAISFPVTGKAKNQYPLFAALGLAILIIGVIVARKFKK